MGQTHTNESLEVLSTYTVVVLYQAESGVEKVHVTIDAPSTEEAESRALALVNNSIQVFSTD